MNNTLELLPLKAEHYPGLNKTAFKLLRRIAFLAKGKTAPFPYSTKEGVNDLQEPLRTVELAFSMLGEIGYIVISKVGRCRYLALSFDAVLDDSAQHHEKRHNSAPTEKLYNHLANAGYMMPCAVLRANPPYLTYDKEPLLNSFRSDLWQIDLTDLVKNSGLDLRPFGKERQWVFNFEPLKPLLKPLNRQFDDIVNLFPDYTGYCWKRPQYKDVLREFFIMSMVIELTVGLKDCFRQHHEFDAFGNNFLDLWYSHQRGPLFSCLKCCYQNDADTYPVAKRIMNGFNPSSGNIIDYACTCVRNEVIALLNQPHTARQCELYFYDAFRKFASKQSYICSTETHLQKDPLWLEKVWGPSLLFGLLSYEEPDYIPRISWPMMLFRTLFGMNVIAKFHWAVTPQACDKATAVLIRSYMDPPYHGDLMKLADTLAPYFPFFEKMKAYLASLKAMEY